jgi:hypothetical protein
MALPTISAARPFSSGDGWGTVSLTVSLPWPRPNLALVLVAEAATLFAARPSSCQGTRTITRLVDTNRYEPDR